MLGREDNLELWAATHSVLAEGYTLRVLGERKRNVEQAIEHCKQALQVR
jgi:hypothetical protein